MANRKVNSMKWTDVPHGKIKGASERIWVTLGDRAGHVVDRINSDPEFVEKISQLMVNGYYEPSTSQKKAHEIMGRNFFGIQEAIKHFGVIPTEQQLKMLEEIPFDDKLLESCKKTHILIAVFGLSIIKIREIASLHSGRSPFYPQDWYDKSVFARNWDEVHWVLIRKKPVTKSTSRKWNAQNDLLLEDEYVPTSRIMTYTIVGHFFSTGERLFKKAYVRCIDMDSSGAHIGVGNFDDGGIGFGSWSNSIFNDDIGLASAKKPSI